MTDDESYGCNAWFKVETGSNCADTIFSMLLPYEVQDKSIVVSVGGCSGDSLRGNFIYWLVWYISVSELCVKKYQLV